MSHMVFLNFGIESLSKNNRHMSQTVLLNFTKISEKSYKMFTEQAFERNFGIESLSKNNRHMSQTVLLNFTKISEKSYKIFTEQAFEIFNFVTCDKNLRKH